MSINFKAERLNRGLSRRDLAAVIGIPDHTVRHIEDGHQPVPSTAKKIADFYGVRVTDLWPVEPVGTDDPADPVAA